MDESKEFLVGKYNTEFDKILGISIGEKDIYQSRGLSKHMIKSKHYKSLKYIDQVPDILVNPDYIGINPNEKGKSIELVKKYADNVMVGIKLDKTKDRLYVATVFDLQEGKIKRRLHSGRLKVFVVR